MVEVDITRYGQHTIYAEAPRVGTPGLMSEAKFAINHLHRKLNLPTDFKIKFSGRKFEGAHGSMTLHSKTYSYYEYRIKMDSANHSILNNMPISFCQYSWNRLFKKGHDKAPKTVYFHFTS
jgi:hypothetical protein